MHSPQDQECKEWIAAYSSSNIKWMEAVDTGYLLQAS